LQFGLLVFQIITYVSQIQ